MCAMPRVPTGLFAITLPFNEIQKVCLALYCPMSLVQRCFLITELETKDGIIDVSVVILHVQLTW